jgi:hypothetical protein
MRSCSTIKRLICDLPFACSSIGECIIATGLLSANSRNVRTVQEKMHKPLLRAARVSRYQESSLQ